MMFSTIQTFLMPIAFTFLLLLMLLYWGQAAFFADSRYNKLTGLIFQFSFFSLTSLLILRWVESGHFPLSNLYESLLFLSWSFLLLHFLLDQPSNSQIKRKKWRFVYRAVLDTFLPFFLKRDVVSKASSPEKKCLQNEALYVDNDENHMHNINYFANRFGLGVIVSPMALLTFGFAFLSLPKDMQKATALVPALQSNWLMMHVTVMICSYAALLCGSVLSIAFLVLHRIVKHDACSLQIVSLQHIRFANQSNQRLVHPRHEDQNFTLSGAFVNTNGASDTSNNDVAGYKPSICKPSNMHDSKHQLEQGFRQNSVFLQGKARHNSGVKQKTEIEHSLATRLDNYSYRVLAFGFPLLTVGILSGAVWANEAWGSYWSWDPKETWALITWLVFAIYLHTRITRGWNGEKSALVASFGFFVVWFCYLGVNLLGTGLHSYGWFTKG